jgi:ribosomal protein S18 acetylase RimI-like enzyme
MQSFGDESSGPTRPLTHAAALKFVNELVDLDAALRAEFNDVYSEMEWTEEHFLRDLPCKWSLSKVAVRNERVVGFIIGSRKTQGAHVHRFAVAAGVRSQGVGRALLDALLSSANAKQLRVVTLIVAENNLPAVRFYRRAGFAVDDVRVIAGDRRQLSMTKQL